MAGWVTVGLEGYEADASPEEWVNLGITYALSLPPKSRTYSPDKTGKVETSGSSGIDSRYSWMRFNFSSLITLGE